MITTGRGEDTVSLVSLIIAHLLSSGKMRMSAGNVFPAGCLIMRT